MKTIASLVMLLLVAHCWLCVFTYYDDNNGKISKYYDWLSKRTCLVETQLIGMSIVAIMHR